MSLAPDDFECFRFTSKEEARAIREEQATIRACNAWEHEHRWRRIGERVRDLAVLGLVAAVWVVVLAVWGRP